jgi:hypothetical protein
MPHDLAFVYLTALVLVGLAAAITVCPPTLRALRHHHRRDLCGR